MNEDPEVTAWLDELDHPLMDVILAVRRVFLEADERITETVKWKSPTYMYEGNLASIDPKAKKHVAVLFHRGAEIPGEEGSVASVRVSSAQPSRARKLALTGTTSSSAAAKMHNISVPKLAGESISMKS